MPRGYRGTGLEWLHVTIWCKPSEWDKIQYDWASSGKQTVSQYVIDKLMECQPNPLSVRDNNVRTTKHGEKGVVKPLCVPADKWEIVKQRANALGLKVSPYVLSVLLG